MTASFERLRLLGLDWKKRLTGHFELCPDDGVLAPAFRAKQLGVVLRMTPMTMLANILNALLIGYTFWSDTTRLPLTGWMLLIGTVVILGLRAWMHPPKKQTASRRALRRAALQASVLALSWGVMTALVFPSATGPQQLLLATLVTGLMSAGGFVLATVPVAGSAWVLILTLASTIALMRSNFPLATPVTILLFIYGFVVMGSVWAMARTFCSRLMAEAQAEQQNQVIGLLLRDFEENASDVLWEVDAQGHLTHIPPRLEQALNMTASELAGKPAPSLLGDMQRLLPEAERSYLPPLLLKFSEGTPFRDAIIPILSSGLRTWWSLSAKPLYDTGGKLSGWRGVASNVTERMQAAEAMRTHNERLEVLVKERTTHLNQALSAAEAANRAKSLFLSSMSHELRTPLNAVLGYAQLMGMNTQASKETREAATEIQAAGSHLLALVNDVLDLARIESGKLEMNIERVDLAQVLEESRRTLDSLAQSRRVTLVIPALQHHVLADPVRLRQVMFNLISNAIKYNCDAGRVTVQGEIRPGRRYRITVSDTGIGIPADRMGELFQPFNRMGAERGSVEGTGIGLVITKTLVESMNGSIGVDSAFGAGSAFWVELPLAAG